MTLQNVDIDNERALRAYIAQVLSGTIPAERPRVSPAWDTILASLELRLKAGNGFPGEAQKHFDYLMGMSEHVRHVYDPKRVAQQGKDDHEQALRAYIAQVREGVLPPKEQRPTVNHDWDMYLQQPE